MARSTTPTKVVTYAGLDYHKKFMVVTLGDQEGKVLSTERIFNDKELVRKFFKQFPGVICAIESCRGYEWLLDFLKDELKLTVHLVNTYQAKLITQSRCKTDKLDSKAIMELLAIGFLPTCYQPTSDERQLRERLRWRAHLVRYVSRMKIRVHSILDKENLGIMDPFDREGRKLLEQAPLTPSRRLLIQEHLQILDYFDDLVAKEDAQVQRKAKASPDATLLMTIPGIGSLSALFIVAELGNVQRFKRSAQVAAYVGLVPSIYSSADKRVVGRITKQGSSMLRWLMVQCAWQSIRYSMPLRMHFASVSRRCGRNPAIVSVARKLIQIAYRVLRDKKAFQAELIGKQPTA